MPFSDSELSDLVYDELQADSESEQEYVPTKSQTRKQAQVSQEYRLQKALKPPRATTYTSRALYEAILGSTIDLSPSYQRDVVWPKDKQINLIDSIFRNFYIPPVIFSVSVEDDGSEHRTCIDGKQRLTSIQLFMDGLIPHRDSVTGSKYWFKHVEGQRSDARRQLLPEKLRLMFSNKQIVCVEYADLTDLDERDIFKRVQQGMALTPSEKLGALSTSRTDFIREILQSHVSETTLGGPSIAWEMSRGSDFRCISQAIYCMDKWASDPDEVKNQGSLSQVEKWLAVPYELPDDFKVQVRETFDIFVRLVTTPKYSAPFLEYKKVSPAEIICIALLIFVHGVFPSVQLQLTRRELCTAITNMRHHVRKDHADVRMNVRVGKTLVDFIKHIEDKETESIPKSTLTSKSKRKRLYVDEDDDAEVEKQLQAVKLGTSSRRKSQPTPAVSAPYEEAMAPPSLSPKKKKKSISKAASTTSVPTTSSLKVERPVLSPSEAFRAHIPLSPVSSGNGTRSADRDTGLDDFRMIGPSESSAQNGSSDVQMADITGAR